MGKTKVIVVGGGAAGLMAAIVAAREGAKVTLLERKDRVGKKILATGNGRCNISNQQMSGKYFHSDSLKIFDDVYKQLDRHDTLAFFNVLGIETVTLDEGKLYPMSLQASSVLNVLRYEAERLGVVVECNEEVMDLSLAPKVKATTKQKSYYGDVLIMATGGKSAPDLGSNGSGYKLLEDLGLKMVRPFPSLIQLESNYGYLKHLKGTKMMANISVVINEQLLRTEYGELLFTDYGVSGPPILQLSRHASKALHHNVRGVELRIDLMPAIEEEAMDLLLMKRIEHMPYKTLEVFFEGMLPKALIVPVIKDNGLTMDMKAADVTRTMRQSIVKWLKGFTLQITGTRQWNQSQVTAGGIDCTMVKASTLQCHQYPNLYICGELLDMDGDCGGYNLQWAWSSGYVAGMNAGRSH